MVLPSGDQEGRSSSLGLVVIALGVSPAVGAIRKMFESRFVSGSAERLLTKAMVLPSGDQAGCSSS